MPFVDGKWVRESWLPPQEWTPGQEWAKIAGRQDPFWETRVPLQQLGTRLQGRYLLGAPRMGQEAWETEPTFEDYVGSWVGGQGAEDPSAVAWRANTYQDLLARANVARGATRRPMGEYMAQFTPGTDDWRQAAWYGAMFNPLEAGQREAEANQLAVATLLAQQRQAPDRAAYGGAMGRAIANALQEQQQYRQDIGQPTGSFLDWYVSQVSPTEAA